MSDSLTLEQKKSRRGLLALVGAGGAAAVAALLGRGNGAEAAVYTWTSTSSDGTGEFVNTGSGTGVKGISNTGNGVYGWSDSSMGVYGHSPSGNGVYGTSSSGRGVYGWCNNAHGVHGQSTTSHGVHGESDSHYGVCGRSDSLYGVYGYSHSSYGVAGLSSISTGVKGTGKPGVYGVSNKNNGAGVRGDGDAPGSIGVFAKNNPGRRALRTKGQVQMDCARTVMLSAKSTKVTLPTDTRAGSNAVVLATTQGNPGNDAYIWRAYRVDSTHIRIAFNKAPANPVTVAYWVVHTG